MSETDLPPHHVFGIAMFTMFFGYAIGWAFGLLGIVLLCAYIWTIIIMDHYDKKKKNQRAAR